MPIIDADCHVIESEQTWEYLDPADEQYKPASMFDPNRPDRPVWVIDGQHKQRYQEVGQRSPAIGVKLQQPLEVRQKRFFLNHLEVGNSGANKAETSAVDAKRDRRSTTPILCRGTIRLRFAGLVGLSYHSSTRSGFAVSYDRQEQLF